MIRILLLVYYLSKYSFVYIYIIYHIHLNYRNYFLEID